MAESERKVERKIVTSAREPTLKNAIQDLLHTERHGMSAASLLKEITGNGIALEYKGLLYKCLMILVKSEKLEKFYSPKDSCILYRIKEQRSL